jgi:hypothetical protein
MSNGTSEQLLMNSEKLVASIVVLGGVILLTALGIRLSDTYHGIDPTWGNTHIGVQPRLDD